MAELITQIVLSGDGCCIQNMFFSHDQIIY